MKVIEVHMIFCSESVYFRLDIVWSFPSHMVPYVNENEKQIRNKSRFKIMKKNGLEIQSIGSIIPIWR